MGVAGVHVHLDLMADGLTDSHLLGVFTTKSSSHSRKRYTSSCLGRCLIPRTVQLAPLRRALIAVGCIFGASSSAVPLTRSDEDGRSKPHARTRNTEHGFGEAWT